MRLLDDNGSELVADFDLESTDDGIDVILHSRSGNKGTETNPDYNAALELILERMQRRRVTLRRVIVDSRPAQSLDIEDRTIELSYPVELAPSIDVHELRIAITEGQRLVASAVDPSSRAGNKHKRIRLSFMLATRLPSAERILGISSEAADQEVEDGPASLGEPYYDDPIDRQLKPSGLYTRDDTKLERSLAAHARLQKDLAKHLRNAGVEPRKRAKGEPDYDIAWVSNGRVVVAEVKSLAGTSVDRQLRIGVGQVLHYRELLHRKFGEPVNAALVVPHDPGGPWHDVCKRAGVVLTWPPGWEGVEVEP